MIADKTYETLKIELHKPFVHVILNRPEVKNAMSQQMVAELIDAFTTLRDDRSIRAVILSGAGNTFCAGGDLKEMQAEIMNRGTGASRMEKFDEMLHAVNRAPQVVIAKVEGVALGGGFGLVCVADIAIASTTASFGLPEVRLGIIPALISPYVISRIGMNNARRLMLTGARFSGQDALTYGVVNMAVAPDELDYHVQSLLSDIRECSPEAIATCKALIFEVTTKPISETIAYRANLLDELRASESGQEGMMAFIQKRKPTWAEVTE
jgi:isohexenylglutaconyl-CoA hydratase